MSNSNHKYIKEIDLLTESLNKFRTLEEHNHSEQAIIITEFFTKVNTMENFLCVFPSFRKKIYSRINDYNSNSIYSAYPKLLSTIKKTQEMLNNIKYREEYICDVIYGEKRQKQIIIEI
jgi:hypothetical protein